MRARDRAGRPASSRTEAGRPRSGRHHRHQRQDHRTTLVTADPGSFGRRQAVAAGNIGVPLIEAVVCDAEVVVAEVSSFQLQFTETLPPPRSAAGSTWPPTTSTGTPRRPLHCREVPGVGPPIERGHGGRQRTTRRWSPRRGPSPTGVEVSRFSIEGPADYGRRRPPDRSAEVGHRSTSPRCPEAPPRPGERARRGCRGHGRRRGARRVSRQAGPSRSRSRIGSRWSATGDGIS